MFKSTAKITELWDKSNNKWQLCVLLDEHTNTVNNGIYAGIMLGIFMGGTVGAIGGAIIMYTLGG